ncbi:MAG: hypothetical protein ACRD0G_14945 [Acidimicrobiales bacterium]
MAVDERARLEMYEAFKQVVGMPHAATLMEHLPPGGWGELATKRDLSFALDGLESRMEAKLHKELRELQRNLFFGFLAAQTAFAGLVLAFG